MSEKNKIQSKRKSKKDRKTDEEVLEIIKNLRLTKITKNSPTSISGGMNWYFFVVKFLKMMYNIFSSNYMKGII